ncbi:hypothetical protein G9A89_017377 [Geosiphon pyriformis]|nr:hypothetical protein G9A89_017377 [Geosiphon pyriformis]
MVPATCDYFKFITTPSTPLIKFEKEKAKPTWEAYQVSWADVNHNELLPILAWDNNDNGKEKQREKLTWKATINTWTDNNQSEMPPILDWEENIPEKTITAEEITSGWEREYSREPIKELPYIPLKCKDWNNMTTQKDKASGTMNHVLLMANNYSMKECGTTFLVKKKHVTLRANTQSSLATGPEEFYEHYQNLAPMRKEQEQHLEEINTQLCDHCLIPCDF